LAPVLKQLSGYAVPRRVDKTGNVSLYNRNQYVGVLHADTTVYVMFDPQAREWLFTNVDGKELRRRPAQEIPPERITALQVAGDK
jgi:hypothetical protein